MFSARASMLVVGPRLRRGPDQLVVSTSWIGRLFSLFSHRTEVRFEGRLQVVFFEKTSLWFLRTARAVRFRDIDHVEYSFRDLPTSWDFFGRIHDTAESFSIGLALKDSTEVVPVARFVGEGAAGDWSTWLMDDDLLDFEGTQADDSRTFVAEVCKLLDVSLGPPPLPPPVDAEGKRWTCGECGRAVAPQPKCLYCGGEARPE